MLLKIKAPPFGEDSVDILLSSCFSSWLSSSGLPSPSELATRFSRIDQSSRIPESPPPWPQARPGPLPLSSTTDHRPKAHELSNTNRHDLRGTWLYWVPCSAHMRCLSVAVSSGSFRYIVGNCINEYTRGRSSDLPTFTIQMSRTCVVGGARSLVLLRGARLVNSRFLSKERMGFFHLAWCFRAWT